MRKLLIGAMLLASSGALAADLPSRREATYTPPPIPVFTWTGLYVGAYGGYGGTLHSDVVGHQDAIVGGGTLGFNWQFAGPLVLGAEIDGGVMANVNHSADQLVVDRKVDAFGTARGRVGFAFDRLLIYGTGGVAAGHVKLNGPFFNNTGTTSTRFGYVLGGGLEYAFTPNWSVKAEGLYYNLTKQTNIGGCGLGVPCVATTNVAVRNDGFIARAGVNYRFGTNLGLPGLPQ